MDARIGYIATGILMIVAALFFVIALLNGDSPNDTFVLVTANVTAGLSAVLGVLTRLLEKAVEYIASTVRARTVNATDSAAPKQ